MGAVWIPEWKTAWRMLSVRVAALLVVWGLLPSEQQAAILHLVGLPAERVPAVMGLLVIVARLVQQPAIRQAESET